MTKFFAMNGRIFEQKLGPRARHIVLVETDGKTSIHLSGKNFSDSQKLGSELQYWGTENDGIVKMEPSFGEQKIVLEFNLQDNEVHHKLVSTIDFSPPLLDGVER